MSQAHEQQQKIKSYLDSALSNANLLDETLRSQLMYNIDQVFHLREGVKIDPQVLEMLKLRQQTLVSETLRRVLGRTRAIQGGIREAIKNIDNIFPQEKGG